MRDKPVIDGQIRAVIKSLITTWFIDKESGNVRTRFEGYLPDLIGFLRRRGFVIEVADSDDSIEKCRATPEIDGFTYVKLRGKDKADPIAHLRRDDENSYFEITNSDLNIFIKEFVLRDSQEKQR